MEVNVLKLEIGAEILVIDLNSELSNFEFATLQGALDTRSVCFPRAQMLEDAGLVALGQ